MVANMKRLIYVLTFLSCLALSLAVTPRPKPKVVIPGSFTHEMKCANQNQIENCITVETIHPPREAN